MSNNEIVIAVDGHASCGKSTLARQLAKKLGYIYVDSGAMYRAVTLFFLRNNIDIKDKQAVEKALKQIRIHFEKGEDGNGNNTFLNEENVELEIRKKEVSGFVSPVSAIKEVRSFLVKQQQSYGVKKGLTMDGRDIGTVVFPNAELKVYLTASIEVRAQRRFAELQSKGIEMSLEEISHNLQERDRIDSTRKESPLRKAEDAITIDNSHYSEEEQLELVLGWTEAIQKKLAKVNS